MAATVSVTGGYFEIEDFLSRLENLVKSPDPASHIPPRSVLVRSVSINSSSSGSSGSSGAASATATTTAATTLTANIGLTVFQHAKAQAVAGTTAAASTATPTTTAGGR